MQSNFDFLVLMLFIPYKTFFMKVAKDGEEYHLKCHLEAVFKPIFRLVPGDLQSTARTGWFLIHFSQSSDLNTVILLLLMAFIESFFNSNVDPQAIPLVKERGELLLAQSLQGI